MIQTIETSSEYLEHMKDDVIDQLSEKLYKAYEYGCKCGKRQSQDLIAQAYQRGYNEGYSKAETDYHAKTEDDRQSSYELGLNMAWEAARKLVSMGYKECNEVLGDGVLTVETDDEIFVRCTASEAIEKLRAYEEQKKQEEDEEIKVGDEVIWTENNSEFGVITRIESSENAMWIIKPNGLQICASKCRYWKKTGRHFPEIAEVLKQMQEGE